MFFSRSLLWALLLAPWIQIRAHAAEQSIAQRVSQCAERLSGADRETVAQRLYEGKSLHMGWGRRWTIPKATRRDLNLNKTVFPWLNTHTSTALGEWRLKEWLFHPLLQPRYIRLRQQAVQYLARNPEVRGKVKDLLGTVGATQSPKDVRQALHIYSEWRNDSMLLVGSTAAVMNAAGLAFGRQGMMLLGYGAMMASLASRNSNQSRHYLLPIKRLLQAAGSVAPVLENTDVALLEFLGGMLRGATEAEHPISLSKLKEKTDRMRDPEKFIFLLDATTAPFMLFRLEGHLRKEYTKLAMLASVLADVDVLVALAELLATQEGLTMPVILDDTEPLTVRMEKVHHPYLYAAGDRSVPNSVFLTEKVDSQEGSKVVFVTGPNKRGKTTLAETVGDILALAQMGAPVPADFVEVTPTAFYTDMKTLGSIVDKESAFSASAKKMGEIIHLSQEHKRAIYLVDEPLTGTSKEEKSAGVEAYIRWMLRQTGRAALVACHDRELTRLEGLLPGIRNYHMSDDDNRIFEFERGPSHRRNGLELLGKVPHMPADLIREAREIYERNQSNENP